MSQLLGWALGLVDMIALATQGAQYRSLGTNWLLFLPRPPQSGLHFHQCSPHQFAARPAEVTKGHKNRNFAATPHPAWDSTKCPMRHFAITLTMQFTFTPGLVTSTWLLQAGTWVHLVLIAEAQAGMETALTISWRSMTLNDAQWCSTGMYFFCNYIYTCTQLHTYVS